MTTIPPEDDNNPFADQEDYSELQNSAWLNMVENFGDNSRFNPEAVQDRIRNMTEDQLTFTANASYSELVEKARYQGTPEERANGYINPWWLY